MRSLGVSPKSAPQSPSSSPATLPQSAVWLTPTVTATSARPAFEQFCPHMTLTYNSPGRAPWRHHLWRLFRQYCRQRALCPTRSFQPESRRAAPLLCAGITTYSPMRHWGVTKGKKVGVVGLGGLGHMAVKFGHALGAHVVVFTTSPNKKEDALRLGADEVVISRNTDEMNKHVNSFDFIPRRCLC